MQFTWNDIHVLFEKLDTVSLSVNDSECDQLHMNFVQTADDSAAELFDSFAKPSSRIDECDLAIRIV